MASTDPATVHPSAVVDDGATLGPGTRVYHFVHVSADARVGARCVLGQGVFVGRGVVIGDGVKLQNGVSVFEGVELADDVFVGPGAVFTNVLEPRAFIERKHEFRATRVGRGATIGAGAVIVCGHDVGEHAFVGAGAVVTRDVAPHALVVGNPARRIAWVSRAGRRLAEGPDPRCPETGERYLVDGERCRLAGEEEPSPGASAPIPMLDLAAQHAPLAAELTRAFERVLAHGELVLGREVAALEESLASVVGVEHAIGVSSGSDALLVTLMALDVGPGDEVITTPFSFFATAGSIARLGARPVFVDLEPGTFLLDLARVEAALTPRTRAIVPVHLFGEVCFSTALRALSEARGVPIVEDAAQALGAWSSEGRSGALGRAGCFSFFPSKNLGALGDGGLVTTDDAALAERVRALRSHGARRKHEHDELGGNFRLDALQAALLAVKLPHLERWTRARRANAARYAELFEAARLPPSSLRLPSRAPGHAYHHYVVRTPRRDELRAHLSAVGITSEVYYPTPLPLQPALSALGCSPGAFPQAERAAREALALPVFPELGEERLRRVAREVLACLGRSPPSD
jgi:dTDP-4-amino-4,6-dideoxygalactose transaminase/acetyltransferase-like isoleucine patch superfamily enzyme